MLSDCVHTFIGMPIMDIVSCYVDLFRGPNNSVTENRKDFFEIKLLQQNSIICPTYLVYDYGV